MQNNGLPRLIQQWSPIVYFCHLHCRGVHRVNRKRSTNSAKLQSAQVAVEGPVGLYVNKVYFGKCAYVLW